MALTLFVGALRSNKLLWVQDCIIQPVETPVTRHRGNRTMKSTSILAAAPQAKDGGIGTDFAPDSVSEICGSLRALLADAFALYLKTKNFHWHMTGRHFRDYHLLLDEQGDQIFAMTDDIAERARKIGGTTLRSVGDIARHQRLRDNDQEHVTPKGMLSELRQDSLQLTHFLRATHAVCDQNRDVASASLIENWIDQTERRTWFLTEMVEEL
jgi:starvation-inducible DNA-binding protein